MSADPTTNDEDRGTYTNYDHGDLGDANPGQDQDFSGPHLDDERTNVIDNYEH